MNQPPNLENPKDYDMPRGCQVAFAAVVIILVVAMAVASYCWR